MKIQFRVASIQQLSTLIFSSNFKEDSGALVIRIKTNKKIYGAKKVTNQIKT